MKLNEELDAEHKATAEALVHLDAAIQRAVEWNEEVQTVRKRTARLAERTEAYEASVRDATRVVKSQYNKRRRKSSGSAQ